MATTDIIFDVKSIDTHLAETFIKTKTELHSIGFIENGSYECDKFNNKIYTANIDEEPMEIVGTSSHLQILDKLYTLAKIIEKNADLFCQLEYLVRGIPVDDVKKCDLKLITDNLLHCYKVKRNKETYDSTYCNRIAFLADTPLAALGFVAQSLCCGCVNEKNYITIISNKDTAIISTLFVDLCRQVGFEEVLLQLVSINTDCSKYNILDIEEMSTGCVGIVTSNCDLDSAVDAVLASTVRYPWALKKIFVQECVLERFRRALAWKAEKRAPGSGGDGVESSWSSSYRCGDKVFAMEAAGPGASRVVSVEAYRTVRELLALLDAPRPLAASLWSADVAESLELAHGLGATLVWVNDFADFRGPPRVSQAFYSVVDVHLSTRPVECDLNTIESLKKSWLRRDTDERRISLIRQCRTRPLYMETVEKYDFPDSFVHVSENCVVAGTIAAPHTLRADFADTSVAVSALTFLINGGGLLVKSLDVELEPVFEDILKIKDVPVVREDENKTDKKSSKVLWRPCYEHKVIWTNYGTMFAN